MLTLIWDYGMLEELITKKHFVALPMPMSLFLQIKAQEKLQKVQQFLKAMPYSTLLYVGRVSEKEKRLLRICNKLIDCELQVLENLAFRQVNACLCWQNGLYLKRSMSFVCSC